MQESMVHILPVFPVYSNSGGNDMHGKIVEFKYFKGEGWSYIISEIYIALSHTIIPGN